MSADQTAPDDLRRWGYAPGHYMVRCCDCKPSNQWGNGWGAKRSWRCEQHARDARDREVTADQTAQADEVVTQEDREAAADLIEAYWLGLGDQHDSMRLLATSYRAGHTQGVWTQAFARHRVASTATLQASLDEARAEIARLHANAKANNMLARHEGVGRREQVTANTVLVEEIARLREALTWIADNYENGMINHVDFRVEAKHRADDALQGTVS